ncbi:C40 family peptidase [Paenibacillus beijingensis]|uniref:Peptidase n=1 Tax=Paenibacillus beijingensis TaxID=1126833 RepID=A0A0D5NNC1_9BACL|nr:C40 family peptidase [Paenibacillus beijingensis]AJY76766.1 peptidase [Paenibacillus beijingensis]
MNRLRQMTVAVSVATVWTEPDSPRRLDEPALGQPAQIAEWLSAMTIDDKLDLYNGNRVQTQILYGTDVLAAGERDGWVKVFVPEQATRKQSSGYPGWVPKRQLMERNDGPATETWAVVVSNRAPLSFQKSPNRGFELSFLTRLPVLKISGDKVIVHTPHGAAFLNKEHVRIHDKERASIDPPQGHPGIQIVRQGLRFLGLPYLWGGMSSFGYDCSGFAYNMLKSQGIVIPRDASDQAEQGNLVERSRLEPGDLLFFAYEEGKGRVHHVGIYAGDNRMLHSPDSKGCVEIVELNGYKLEREHCVSRRYWTPQKA